jgi:dTDP-4-amino-4,6-dideoxygalactose transaminase
MNKLLPLAQSSWDRREYGAIQRVVDSGFFSMGKEVASFEEKAAEFLGSKYAVMVNSGSSANLLAIAAMFFKKEGRLKAGDEVIVPAVSWSTSYYPLQQYGLKLKFVDVDLNTLNMDIDQLKKCITDQTRLVLLVNLLGNPNDFQSIKEILEPKGIPYIEDNCESLGATYMKKQAGTYGLLGTYSSFFSHHISTMEGGWVVTDDLELYHLMLSLRAHGWTRNLPKNNTLIKKSDDPFEESFRFILPGYNLRPLEMSGAIGLEQLKKLPGLIQGRRKNAAFFQDEFSSLNKFRIQKELGESSWFGFSLIIDDDGLSRKKVIQTLTDRGVDCRPIVAGNFTKNPVMRWINSEIVGELPNAQIVDTQGFFIGNHHVDVREALSEVKKILLSF